MQITEQDIRRLAIGHLRLHYKYRPRRDWDGIQVVDQEHSYQGITIDARLTYLDPEGQPFIATVEATSMDKRGEVDYRHHWFRLLYEALTLALLATAIVFGVLPESWNNLLANYELSAHWWPKPALVLFSWGIFCIFLNAAFHRRYRYIYAIEQFKLFHADDQWIAFDAKLFNVHEDERLNELERQCIQFGFGMMQVDAEREVRTLITPKRGDYFGHQRKVLPAWLTALGKAPVVGKMVENRLSPTRSAALPAAVDPLSVDPLAINHDLVPSNADVTQDLLPQPAASGRLRSSVVRLREQWKDTLDGWRPRIVRELPGFFVPPAKWRVWLIIGIVLHVTIMVWAAGKEVIVSPASNPKDLVLEDEYDYRAPVDMELEKELNSLENINDGYERGPEVTDLDPVIDESRLNDLASRPATTDVFYYHLGAAGDTIVREICPRFGDSTTPVYALVYGRYPNLDAALAAAFSLHREQVDLEVNVSHGSCLESSWPGYYVLIDAPSADEGLTNLRIREIQRDRKLTVEVMSL